MFLLACYNCQTLFLLKFTLIFSSCIKSIIHLSVSKKNKAKVMIQPKMSSLFFSRLQRRMHFCVCTMLPKNVNKQLYFCGRHKKKRKQQCVLRLFMSTITLQCNDYLLNVIIVMYQNFSKLYNFNWKLNI